MDAQCSCPRGQAICHHMGALAIYGHHNISVTDKACAWNAPKVSTSEVKTLSHLYPDKNTNYCAVKRKVTNDEVDAFLKDLGTEVVGFTWLLRPEVSEKTLRIIPQIEDLIFSSEYQKSNDKIALFENYCLITQNIIGEVAKLTIGQSTNELWQVARKHRLTASKFGKVLAACKRNKFPPSLFTHLMEEYDLSSIRAVQWGREHEAEAIEIFKETTALDVVGTGLWLLESGYLGASPDGLVGDDAIIEVKCPYK